MKLSMAKATGEADKVGEEVSLGESVPALEVSSLEESIVVGSVQALFAADEEEEEEEEEASTSSLLALTPPPPPPPLSLPTFPLPPPPPAPPLF